MYLMGTINPEHGSFFRFDHIVSEKDPQINEQFKLFFHTHKSTRDAPLDLSYSRTPLTYAKFEHEAASDQCAATS